MRSDLLHVIGVYSNPRRYAVRPRLLRQWAQEMLDSGVNLYLVQHAFGERPFDFDPADPLFKNATMFNVRGGAEHELWLQYAMYNHAIKRLPPAARYVCWQDTDVKHLRRDWAAETVHMLQHAKAGQTWTNSIDMDPNGNIARNEWGNEVDRSFCAAWTAGDVKISDGPYRCHVTKALLPKKDDKTRDWRSHTGYSWAIRREVIDAIGPIPDWLIGGSSDWHMALAFSGRLRQMVEEELAKGSDKRYSPNYYKKLREFAIRCDTVVEQDIAAVSGTLVAGWHGTKKNRMYGGREDILTEANFDPDLHLYYDHQGLPCLRGNSRVLRDGLRRYGQARNEDSIDV